MLPGVLLHVIAAAGAIDDAVKCSARSKEVGGFNSVENFACFVFRNIDDANASAVRARARP